MWHLLQMSLPHLPFSIGTLAANILLLQETTSIFITNALILLTAKPKLSRSDAGELLLQTDLTNYATK